MPLLTSTRISRRTFASLLFLAALVPGLVLPEVELLAINQYLVLAISVTALNFSLGLGGQASLAQGAFMGMGAYASALLHQLWPGASLVIIPVVTLTVFLAAYILSRPLEKLHEGFLAMATLGLGLIFTNMILSLERFTNGPAGMMVDTRPGLPGLDIPLSGDRAYYYVFILILAGALFVFARLRDSRLGRALLACKGDRAAAASCGIDSASARALAFGLGAGISALCGAFFAHYSGFISPRQFDLELSLKTLLYLVIGGPGRLYTPAGAVLILEAVFGRLHFLEDARVLFHGVLFATALLIGLFADEIVKRGRTALGFPVRRSGSAPD